MKSSSATVEQCKLGGHTRHTADRLRLFYRTSTVISTTCTAFTGRPVAPHSSRRQTLCGVISAPRGITVRCASREAARASTMATTATERVQERNGVRGVPRSADVEAWVVREGAGLLNEALLTIGPVVV